MKKSPKKDACFFSNIKRFAFLVAYIMQMYVVVIRVLNMKRARVEFVSVFLGFKFFACMQIELAECWFSFAHSLLVIDILRCFLLDLK